MAGYAETRYVAKVPDKNGFVSYASEEHAMWKFLYERQIQTIKQRACAEFFNGLEKLELQSDMIPQAHELNEKLLACTGWQVEMVSAVIPADDFFKLLANKKFPMATFIRSMNEVDYLQEPDIFHEVFGHCPLLTQPNYAKFVENYGKIALQAPKKLRKYLFRLFWFSIEFGLIKNEDQLQIYGGGILSSHQETIYALKQKENDLDYAHYDILTMMRTPFRIDKVQPLYFYIQSFDDLFQATNQDLLAFAEKAIELGDIRPRRPFVDEQGNILKYTN